MSDSELKVTSAAEYAERVQNQPGDLIPLPSGAVFRIQLPNAFWFLDKGDKLPSAIYGAEEASALPAGKVLREFSEMQFALIQEKVLEPRIRRPADPAKGEIDPKDLDPDDAKFIMDLLNGRIDRHGRSLRPTPEIEVASTPGAAGTKARQVGDGVTGNGASGIASQSGGGK